MKEKIILTCPCGKELPAEKYIEHMMKCRWDEKIFAMTVISREKVGYANVD